MDCVDTGANIASVQTQPIRGPVGVAAVLKVSSADDHMKNTHLCMAEYQLLIMPAAAGASSVVDILSSDGDYSRKIVLRLDGFSPDGKHVFGLLSEGGKTPLTMLFDYDTAGGGVQLADIIKLFGHSSARKCSSAIDVIGIAPSGALVLESSPTQQCGAMRRWLLDSARSQLQPLPQGASTTSLYRSPVGAP